MNPIKTILVCMLIYSCSVSVLENEDYIDLKQIDLNGNNIIEAYEICINQNQTECWKLCAEYDCMSLTSSKVDAMRLYIHQTLDLDDEKANWLDTQASQNQIEGLYDFLKKNNATPRSNSHNQ